MPAGQVIVGGPGARSVRTYGDIALALQYINEEEAMVLFPVQKKTGAIPFVICLSALHKYTDDEYLIRQSRLAAQLMRLDENKSTVFKIAKIINDNMDEVVNMKPEPMKLVELGEGKVICKQTGESFESVLREEVPEH